MQSMYERRRERLAPMHIFYRRLGKSMLIAFTILLLSLAVGILGYQITIPEFTWYDSLLNASMILSGMGPVIDSNIILSNKAKVFASLYALFSGITFLSTFGVLIAPILHRVFHKFHLDDNSATP